MINRIASWIFPIFLLVIGFQFTADHFKLKSQISNFESLVAEGTKMKTILNSEYREVTTKIAGIPIKSYEFDYSFNHNNKQYTGKESFPEVPKSLNTYVTFLPDNPSINHLNPSEELNKLKQSKSNFTYVIIGLIMMLLGAYSLTLKKKFQKSNK